MSDKFEEENENEKVKVKKCFVLHEEIIDIFVINIILP